MVFDDPFFLFLYQILEELALPADGQPLWGFTYPEHVEELNKWRWISASSTWRRA